MENTLKKQFGWQIISRVDDPCINALKLGLKPTFYRSCNAIYGGDNGIITDAVFRLIGVLYMICLALRKRNPIVYPAGIQSDKINKAVLCTHVGFDEKHYHAICL